MADTINGYSRDDLRRYALDLQRLHTPANQEDNGYDRCAHCHYTRHPCEVHDMATAVLELLDAGRTDDPWQAVSSAPFPGPYYRVCTDSGCQKAFAYPKGEHFHFLGSPDHPATSPAPG